MGRPTKNAEHPLVRLRNALSTPIQQMTRARFSKKVGIPEATIKAIESGKFKLSDKNAAQIASVTHVNPRCLIDPSFPLADRFGIPFEGQIGPLAPYLGGEYLDIEELFFASVDVAEEKQKRAVFSFLFQRWLEEASEILGLRKAISDKLLARYPSQCFAAIPKYFWPKDPKRREDLAKRVARFEEELGVEFAKTLNPKMRAVDQKTLMGHLAEAKAELAKEKTVPKRLAEGFASFLYPFVKGDLNFEKLHWDLRRRMIEQAKAS